VRHDTQHNDIQHNDTRIMKLSIKGLYVALSINDIEHNNVMH
jgi:hypothetical protein